jgi:N6-adenosine-specific RNA methylase IME4
VLDPPWDISSQNMNHLNYPTMKLPEIAALPVGELAAADGCHLYLWVTHMFLPAGLELVKGWGFEYRHLHTWIKDGGFTPATYQLSTEHVIFAVRGSLGVMRKGVRVDFEATRREHSRKPDVFYEMVRDVSPARRLEMFAREDRAGFSRWGNDTERFDA